MVNQGSQIQSLASSVCWMKIKAVALSPHDNQSNNAGDEFQIKARIFLLVDL